MPLAAAKHSHKPMEAFLWGLLPDNTAILDRWARRFQVSARNPFALMSHVGEDCAGAVQFVRPERLDDVVGQGPSEIDWLDEAGVAERLRALRADYPAGYRSIQPRRRPTEDRTAVRERTLGSTVRAHTDDPYIETAHRRVGWACRERTCLHAVGLGARSHYCELGSVAV